jgi:hypothetical protein
LRQVKLNNGGSLKSLALLKMALDLSGRDAGGPGENTLEALKMQVFWVLFFSIL